MPAVSPTTIAGMPDPGSLPAEIRDLAFRHGFELSHNRWESDVRELVRRLGLDVAVQAPTEGVETKSTRLERKSEWLKAIAISGFAVTTASLVVFWWPSVDYDNLNEEVSRLEAVNTESMGPVAYPETKLLVTAFQKELGLPADGIIGPLTQSALRTFQKERDIAADGKIGWETERALKAFLQERGRMVGRIIPDDEGAAVPTPQPSPYRPIAELAEMAKVARAVGLFISDDAGRCTSFLVEDGRAVVPAFCLPEAAETDRMRLRLDYNADDAPFRDVGIGRIEERGCSRARGARPGGGARRACRAAVAAEPASRPGRGRFHGPPS